MSHLSATIQSGDWKGEKHVPVIHAPETIKKGNDIEVKVSVGEEIPHPNTLEHYIGWIKVFFQPEGQKFPIEIASFEFDAHGESGVFTKPTATFHFMAEQSGVISALSYCNIHGLWENKVSLKVEE